MVKGRKEEAEEEEEEGKRAVLTPPLALEGGFAAEHRPPNVLQRVLSLFRNVRPGSDLTHFQLPPLFNVPKSQLQCYGEGVYCIGEDYLSKCVRGKSSLERFASVVAWSISTTRPAIFGLAPFNPVLGETHHVSRANLNVLLEQVSHHPPVSALHATDEKENLELIWWHNPVPRFHGTSVEAVVNGKRQLRLLSFGENYEMDSPKLVIRILPAPGVDWVGTVKIQCKDSGLEAELRYYRSHSFFGFGGNSRSVKGKIFHSKSLKTIYEIEGQWDRIISLKDVHSGEVRVLYDAKTAISKLKTPIVEDPKGLWSTESAVVWAEVSRAILNKDWEKAWKAKGTIEERERKLRSERESKGEVWVPKHFSVSRTKESEWECWPLEQSVPPAPVIVPP
ncbi:oxysterol-binding protein-related protein 4C isoform X1 [Elaeis guineensis]|uniref:Oxysterol-binding protein-related protein 4C isoform X1 n=1 Tax=Elaeis guineensis var. tenera TaxID=51953 RepID=A0A6I9RRJ3_ELAGV|nr:oxysterol-binding protein-related protein 4C isoform X1 [Elaeis guineensis]